MQLRAGAFLSPCLGERISFELPCKLFLVAQSSFFLQEKIQMRALIHPSRPSESRRNTRALHRRRSCNCNRHAAG